MDHQRAHGYYPSFLWKDGERLPLPGNTHADGGKTPEMCIRDSTGDHAGVGQFAEGNTGKLETADKCAAASGNKAAFDRTGRACIAGQHG